MIQHKMMGVDVQTRLKKSKVSIFMLGSNSVELKKDWCFLLWPAYIPNQSLRVERIPKLKHNVVSGLATRKVTR
jgi:hypothetical protein